MKVKNKSTDGKYICGGTSKKGCGTEVTVGSLVHGIVFCLKCGGK